MFSLCKPTDGDRVFLVVEPCKAQFFIPICVVHFKNTCVFSMLEGPCKMVAHEAMTQEGEDLEVA